MKKLGHYHDDLKNRIILKHMSITCANRLLFIPIFIFLTILGYLLNGDVKLLYVYIAIAVICSILGLHRLYFIGKYEVSANRDAIINISGLNDMLGGNRLKVVACCASISQGLFVLVNMIFGMVLFDSTFYILFR